MSRPVPARVISKAMKQKFAFYDLVLRTPTHPHHAREELFYSPRVYEGAYGNDGMSAKERMEKVFGGRIRGDDRQLSSRVMRQEPRVIAGVTVPLRPQEPDNCCMSGCINCVWEMYNDDVKDWKAKQKEAAKAIKSKGGVWPADFWPPIKLLNPENIPEEVKGKEADAHENEWDGVPVAMRVFAETEKKIKARRAAREAATEEKGGKQREQPLA